MPQCICLQAEIIGTARGLTGVLEEHKSHLQSGLPRRL